MVNIYDDHQPQPHQKKGRLLLVSPPMQEAVDILGALEPSLSEAQLARSTTVLASSHAAGEGSEALQARIWNGTNGFTELVNG